MSAGYIYCLSNPSMPGLYKVGYTSKTPEERVRELCSTGVPKPFEIKCSKYVSHPKVKEGMIHDILTDFRHASNREFFECSLSKIQQLFDLCDETQPGDDTMVSSTPVPTVSSKKPKPSKYYETLDELKEGIGYHSWRGDHFTSDSRVLKALQKKYDDTMKPANLGKRYDTMTTIYWRGPDEKLAVRLYIRESVFHSEHMKRPLYSFIGMIQNRFYSDKVVGVKRDSIRPQMTSLAELSKQIIDNLEIPVNTYTKKQWEKCRIFIDFQCCENGVSGNFTPSSNKGAIRGFV